MLTIADRLTILADLIREAGFERDLLKCLSQKGGEERKAVLGDLLGQLLFSVTPSATEDEFEKLAHDLVREILKP